jgi:TatD DNase family protein
LFIIDFRIFILTHYFIINQCIIASLPFIAILCFLCGFINIPFMTLIDTHCHIYGEDFTNDVHETIQRAFEAGVKQLYMPAIDSTYLENMFSLEKAYPGKCFAMAGLHPCYVKENYQSELDIIENLLAKRQFVAIGEIGLDFYWDTSFATQQYQAFETQMQWALQYQLPIVIHTRKAMQETIDAVKPFANKGLKGIFHCFSGTATDAAAIIDMGFSLGIGGVVTYKNSGLAEVVAQTGLEHIVLETDAPYLTPVPYRGKRNESAYLTYIAAKIADIKNITIEEVAEISSANAKKIFVHSV